MQKINRKKETVVFTGYYGMSNFGDDIFGAVSAWGATTFWDVECKILAPRIKGVNADYSVPDWFNRNLYASTNTVGQLSRLGFTLREASRSNQLIFAGGSIFTSASSGVMKVIEKIVKKTRLGVSGIGVSIGPFTNNSDALKVKSFIERFDYLSVRDNASYSAVKEFNLDLPVTMAGDLAGAFQTTFDISGDKTQQAQPIIGIGLCNFESFIGQDSDVENKRNLALIAGTIQAAKNCDAKVFVFSLNNHPEFGDDDIARVLCEKLSKEGIEHQLIRNSEHSIEDVWRQIAICDAFLSVRLHGAIVAYLCEVPFALVEYHQKCTDFLEDIGQDDNYKLAGDVNDSATVCHTIENLLSTRHHPKMTTAEYRKRSFQHFLAAPWAKKTMHHEY